MNKITVKIDRSNEKQSVHSKQYEHMWIFSISPNAQIPVWHLNVLWVLTFRNAFVLIYRDYSIVNIFGTFGWANIVTELAKIYIHIIFYPEKKRMYEMKTKVWILSIQLIEKSLHLHVSPHSFKLIALCIP